MGFGIKKPEGVPGKSWPAVSFSPSHSSIENIYSQGANRSSSDCSLHLVEFSSGLLSLPGLAQSSLTPNHSYDTGTISGILAMQ